MVSERLHKKMSINMIAIAGTSVKVALSLDGKIAENSWQKFEFGNRYNAHRKHVVAVERGTKFTNFPKLIEGDTIFTQPEDQGDVCGNEGVRKQMLKEKDLTLARAIHLQYLDELTTARTERIATIADVLGYDASEYNWTAIKADAKVSTYNRLKTASKTRHKSKMKRIRRNTERQPKTSGAIKGNMVNTEENTFNDNQHLFDKAH